MLMVRFMITTSPEVLVVVGFAEALSATNVATQGPHARRSRWLYQKAFGDSCVVGIIALRNLEYDPAQWWRTSEGVREVIGESLAYLLKCCSNGAMEPL